MHLLYACYAWYYMQTFFKVFIETPKAYFHLMLIPKYWYKDEYITLSNICSSEIVMNSCQNDQNDTQITLEFTRKYTVNDLLESYFKQISQKQLKFGTLMGEVKKVIQFEELIRFIRKYNKRREAQLIQAESIRQQDLVRKK
jgi:hypothetical protein